MVQKLSEVKNWLEQTLLGVNKFWDNNFRGSNLFLGSSKSWGVHKYVGQQILRVKPFTVEAIGLIKFRYNFQSVLWEFWVKAIEAFTNVTKLVEVFGLVESVL